MRYLSSSGRFKTDIHQFCPLADTAVIRTAQKEPHRGKFSFSNLLGLYYKIYIFHKKWYVFFDKNLKNREKILNKKIDFQEDKRLFLFVFYAYL